MKITGFKSEKKKDFSTSVKAWIEKTLTCCVSMRRPASLLGVSVLKAKYVQMMRFLHWNISIKFGKNTSALFK